MLLWLWSPVFWNLGKLYVRCCHDEVSITLFATETYCEWYSHNQHNKIHIPILAGNPRPKLSLNYPNTLVFKKKTPKCGTIKIPTRYPSLTLPYHTSLTYSYSYSSSNPNSNISVWNTLPFPHQQKALVKRNWICPFSNHISFPLGITCFRSSIRFLLRGDKFISFCLCLLR